MATTTVPFMGRDLRLYINTGTEAQNGTGTFTELDMATDITVDETADEIDITNRQSARAGWKAAIKGLKAFKVDFDMHIPAVGETPNDAVALLLERFYSDENVEILVAEGDALLGTEAVNVKWCVASIGGGNNSNPLNEATTKSISLFNIGPVHRTTFTTGTPGTWSPAFS